MKKQLILFIVALLPVYGLYAHVGSPGVSMEGTAGPYHLLVMINPPDVIPGTATITVFVQNGPATSVSVQPIYFYSGKNGAPPADQLIAVSGQPGKFTGIVWLMNNGSASIELQITGQAGRGEMIVPIMALSTAEKKLPGITGGSLVILGSLLFILLVTIVGASVGEGITKKDKTVSPAGKRSKRIAFAVAAVLSSLIVYGGNRWWQGLAGNYQKYMFKPMHAAYDLRQKDGANELFLTIDTLHAQRRSGLSYVIPDHGKLMHLFIIRIPAMDAFAHLHPLRLDSATFKTDLPALPKGKYLAFADIVYHSGFTETLKDSFTINQDLNDSLHRMDPDDAYAFALALPDEKPDQKAERSFREDRNTIVCRKPGAGVKMKDGSVMVLNDMNGEGYQTGQLYALHFTVFDSNKQPANLDPYLGMKGHAAIIRNDGNVYIHIHPVGTYSVAAQEDLIGRVAKDINEYQYPDREKFRDSIDGLVRKWKNMNEKERNDLLMKQMKMPAMKGMNGDSRNSLSFPYTFPQPGLYRIWVQVKINGQVLTAAFDRTVI
ncbi:hypothetical protein ACX0G9_13595 [Flavitalea flava]